MDCRISQKNTSESKVIQSKLFNAKKIKSNHRKNVKQNKLK